MSRSSMSRSDMWHPEHPPSHTVATRGFTSVIVVSAIVDPFLFRAGRDDVLEEPALLLHFRHRFALLDERAGRADEDALAARGAALGRAPDAVEVGDDLAGDPPVGDVPRVGSLDLVADPHAARAEDTPVPVDDEILVRGVERFARIEIRNADAEKPDVVGEILELAV